MTDHKKGVAANEFKDIMSLENVWKVAGIMLKSQVNIFGQEKVFFFHFVLENLSLDPAKDTQTPIFKILFCHILFIFVFVLDYAMSFLLWNFHNKSLHSS